MGTTHSMEYAGLVAEGAIGMRTAVAAQLQSNHFPPISLDFVQPALLAIMAGAQEEWDEPFLLPNGRTLTAIEIIDGLHLHEFVEAQRVLNGVEADPEWEDLDS